MTPILYSKGETDFTHNGLGYLNDIIKAAVVEERNGAYELSFQYPLSGARYSLITEGAIVKCRLDDSRGNQLFRIYKSSKPLKGIVTFSAEHISYDLNGLPLAGFSCAGVTPAVAIDRALRTFEDTDFEHSFTVRSDISTLNQTEIKEPCSMRGLLGGREGSILDVWGGEYEFDNFEIILHEHRGSDNGVTIEYGKNLTDLKQEVNIIECYTHIMPYAVYNRDDGKGGTEEVYVYLPERTIMLPNAPSLGHYRAFLYDCSGEFENDEIPTAAKIRIFANRYAESHDLVTPKVNVRVSFVDLANTLEYKNIAPLERVRLCDTVAVKFAALGITAKAKVIKTDYDVLKEKYESVTIGDAKSSFADTVNRQSAVIGRINARISENRSRAAIELENAIARATEAITGQSGGYVVLNPSEHPQEILILDKQSGGDIEQALNVWRFNSGGLGFSSSGYDGPFETAITMKGEIIGSFIAAHTIAGEALVAGSVDANAISQSLKQTIADNISGSASTLRQEFTAADGVLRSAIALKLDTEDLGTEIEQNAESVRIAWNGNSKYIKLENSELNIYSDTNKLISFNSSGEDLYYLNHLVGNIGGGYWENPSSSTDYSKRGIGFHLENDASYMSWSWKESASSDAYTYKWMYAARTIPKTDGSGNYAANTLHAGCDLDLHNYELKNVTVKNWAFSGGTVSCTISGYYATEYWDDGRAKSWRSFSLTFNHGILQSATF